MINRTRSVTPGILLLPGLLFSGLCSVNQAVADEEPLPELVDFAVGTKEGHTLSSSVRQAAISQSGRWLATAGEPSDPTKEPRTILLWDLNSQQIVKTLIGHQLPIRDLAFSPREDILVSLSFEPSLNGSGETFFWNVRQGQQIRQLPEGGETMQISADGGSVAIAGHGQVRVYNLQTGQETQRWPASISGHSPRLVTPSVTKVVNNMTLRDHRLQLVDLLTNQELAKFEGPQSRPQVALSPDERTLIASDGEDVIVWEVASAEVVHRLKGHERKVTALTFSPDGRFVLSAASDRTIRCWELATGKECRLLKGHRGPITTLMYSGDGTSLVSASLDRKIFVWDSPKIPRSLLPDTVPDEKQLAELWRQLRIPEPKQAYYALGLAAVHQEVTVPYLKQQVHQTLVPSKNKRIKELIVQLGDADYVVRHRATDELKQLRVDGRDIMIKTLRETDSAEVRYRLRRILQGVKDAPRFLPPDFYRFRRIIQLSEQIGDQDSREMLELIIEHLPEETIVKEAKATLERIKKR